MKQLLASRTTTGNFFTDFADMIVLKYLLKRSETLATLRGAPMAVFANDWIGENIYVKGIYEKESIYDIFCVFDHLEIDMSEANVFDVGANIGNHSMQFSMKFKSVMAFEPNPRIFEILSSNVKRLENIECLNIGLGKQSDNLTLYEDQQNFGGSSAVHKHIDANSFDIEIKKMDDFFGVFSTIDLIKIDVEGMECDVLLGGQKVINTHKPIICFEQLRDEFKNDHDETQTISFLRANGYKLFVTEIANEKRSWIYKRLRNFYSMFFGVNRIRNIVEKKSLSKQHYSIIIAIHQDSYAHSTI